MKGTLPSQGIRRRPEDTGKGDMRDAFSIDVDRILHSRAYTSYIDKTQVFYLVKNDHITHRVLHVQLVSKIARTIGRFLRLNEDLIEAIALGHDIGHTPFGHDGERYLTALCHEHGIGYFLHNVQSVQFLDRVERQGDGWNLCLQTLDGILCHDGEIHNQILVPFSNKSFDKLDKEIYEKKVNPALQLTPMTLEGCVVRMADTISYIGRDIEDAIELKLINRDDIPEHCAEVLGRTNGTIVYRLVADLISNGCEGEIGFSKEVSEALQDLKSFNYSEIYLNKAIKPDKAKVEQCFSSLLDKYLDEINREDHSSVVYTRLMKFMDKGYMHDTPPAAIAVDFIAGMTDDYFLKEAAFYGCSIPKKI